MRSDNSLKVGDIFSSEIRDLTSDGRGVATHSSGLAVFVPGVWKGEAGQFRITGMKGRVAFGELIQLEVSSDHRVTAECKHHGFSQSHCGGCPWQYIEYSEQLRVKQEKVERAFEKFKAIKEIKSILPSPVQFGYRNRAQLKTNGDILGYVANASNTIASIDECSILTTKNRKTLRALVETLPNNEWQPRKKNQWTTIDIDESTDVKSVSLNRRLPFAQANSEQNKAMQLWLSTHLQKLDRDKNVLELFCGSGNFTHVISELGFKNILAVEGDRSAIDVLQSKKLSGVKAEVCNLFDEAAFSSLRQIQKDTEILILDPPRDGLKNKDGMFTKKSKIKDIFYISCDLATFARDIKFFQEYKFKVKEIQPLDQFPHTPHIELMAHLSR